MAASGVDFEGLRNMRMTKECRTGSTGMSNDEQLCWKCRGLLQAECPEGFDEDFAEVGDDSFESRYIRPNSSVWRVSEEGCRLCRIFLHTLYRRGKLDRGACPGLSLQQYSFEPSPTLYALSANGATSREVAEVKDSRFELYTASAIDPYVGRIQLEPSTDSETTWSVINDWLNHCDAQHDCKAAVDTALRRLPYRLIDVTPGQPVRLRTTPSEVAPQARYATLSHCWGSQMPLRLLKSNMDDLRRGVPVSQLTKTFQDAMTTCRHIGVSYLWIDSLCIIQDCPDDWASQSAAMADVYSGSYCNIFAAHARDGTAGCFASRDPEALRPVRIRVDWGDLAGAHYAVPENYWTRMIDDAPLNTRAWVFQERLLARRNLIFGACEVVFECCRGIASEQFPRGIPPQLRSHEHFRGVRPDVDGRRILKRKYGVGYMSGEEEAFCLWNHLVEQYSKAQLTIGTDRLVALSALASEIAKHLKSPYKAGLWLKHLPFQLLWEPVDTEKNQRPATFIAPSWSWACATSSVRSVWSLPRVDGQMDADVEVIEAVTTLVNPAAPFGQVSSGYLRLRGHLARGTPVKYIHYTGDSRLGLSFLADKSQSRVRLDMNSMPEVGASRQFYFLPVRSFIAYNEVQGLVLREVDCGPKMKCYERVGVFVYYGRLEALLSASRAFVDAKGEAKEEGQQGGYRTRQEITIV